MLAGDFNTVFDRSLDRRGSDPFDVSRESSCALNRLLNACSSIDIWRYLHPTSSSYTWTRSNSSFSSRIDFISVPQVWVPSVSSCDIGRVGLVVRALAFHQCGPGSASALGVKCGLSLLVLYSAIRGFSPGTPVFPSHQKPTFDLICRK